MIQAYDSIMCGYFCIRFINFMLSGKKLTEYTNLFWPNDLKKRMIELCLFLKMNNNNNNIRLNHVKSVLVSSTSNDKLMILSKCAICNSKISKFINKQQAKGLLSNLGIKTPLGKIPILGDIYFE